MSKVINLQDYKEEKIMNNTARKTAYGYEQDVINVMTFDDWNDIHDSIEYRNQQKRRKARRMRAKYYYRQRIFGVTVMAAGVIIGIVAHCTNITALEFVGAITAVAGLYTVFTKHMLFVDEYFLEQQDKLYR